MPSGRIDSLRRYLEAYHSLSSFSARNARLTHITLSSLTLSTSANTSGSSSYTIPLDPPLKSWSEARERLVSMDKLCLEKLDRSPITLTTYIPPRGFHLLLGVLTIATLITFSSPTHLIPHQHSRLFGPLPIYMPGWFSFLHFMQKPVLYFMIIVHGGESYWMARTRLRRHSVPVGSALWWKWVVGTFLEGFGNFERVDGWVGRERERREKAKH